MLRHNQNLTFEKATKILNSIKKYSKQDWESLVFGKVLKNEIYEGFWDEMNHFLVSVHELMKVNK